MRIGIVSDSHGKANRLRRALAELVARGAEAIVHCGDVGSAECIAALGEADAEAYVVPGNMDRRPQRLHEEAIRQGVHFSMDSILVPLGEGSYLAATHGNNASAVARLLALPSVRYLCHGHTHESRDERAGKTRIINPGALRHAHPATVALLDTDTDTLDLIEVR